jgi:hypothetical protein
MTQGRILVAEDDMENYQLLRFSLERVGHNVLVAVSSCDGVDGRQTTKITASNGVNSLFMLAGLVPCQANANAPCRHCITVISPTRPCGKFPRPDRERICQRSGRQGTKVSFKAVQPVIKNGWPVTCR